MISFKGVEKILGLSCIRLYKSRVDPNDEEIEVAETFWVRQDSAGDLVPVRYEKKQYNTATGVLKEHFNIDYNSYTRKIDDLFPSKFALKMGNFHEKKHEHFA